MNKVEITAHVKSFGWLRRSELDHRDVEMWESPDGALWPYPKGTEPTIKKTTYSDLGPPPDDWQWD